MDNATIAHSHANLGNWSEAIVCALSDSNVLLSLCSNPNINDKVLNQLMNCIDSFIEPTHLMNALAENLPMDVSQDSIQRLYQFMIKYHDKSMVYHLMARISSETSKEKTVQDFFGAMEHAPDLHHFATIKSYYTGSYETIKDSIGSYSVPDLMVASGIESYAKKVQALVLKDRNINVFTHRDSKHITLYRGFTGAYAETISRFIEDKSQSNPDFTFSIPTLYASNWTTDRILAETLARRPVNGHVNDSGIVITLDVNVEHIIHSSFHNPVLTNNLSNVHSHALFIVGQPTGTFTVSAVNVDRAVPMAKTESLQKNAFKKILPLATAFALAGSPTNVADMDNHFGSMHRDLVTEHESAPKAPDNNHILDTIKQIESSGGKNTNHPLVTGGLNAGTRAIGSTALMPLQVKEIANKDPNLKIHAKALNQFDHVKDQDKIAQYVKDHNLEDTLASSHLKRIQAKFPNDLNRQIYSWNAGITGAMKASKEKINNHDYVKKFHKYSAMRKLAGK